MLDTWTLTVLMLMKSFVVISPLEWPSLMSGYVSLPPAWRDDPTSTDQWVRRALDHVATLPPKVTKATKAKRSKSSRE